MKSDATDEYLSGLHEQMTSAVSGRMLYELGRIQLEQFPRHRVWFIDAMGMSSVRVGERDCWLERDDERLKRAFRRVNELMEWYADVSDTYRLTADEVDLEPLR